MPQKLNLEYIKDRLPVRYRIHVLVRGFMILLSGGVAAYSVYFLWAHVTSTVPLFFKLLPLIIFFVGMDSLLKHLLSLNSVTFWEKELHLGFLAKPSIRIPYENLISMDLKKQITYYLYLVYKDNKGREQTFRIKGSFPKVLEIILNLYDLVPHLELSEKMKQTCQYLAENVRSDEN